MHVRLLAGLVLLMPIAAARAGEPCASGLAPGQRPGPYSSVVSVGAERGQSHCYICDTGDKPAVVVFARATSENLGKLARGLDKAVGDNKASELRAWMTFLNADQTKFDPQLVQWSRQLGLRNLPLSVFEDVGGPPTYRLSAEAEVTVLLFVKQKVVANFAYRRGELSEKDVATILEGIGRLVGAEEPKALQNN